MPDITVSLLPKLPSKASTNLGAIQIKARLEEILQSLIAPIRERREQLSKDPAYIISIIGQGTERAKERTEATKQEIIKGIGLFQL
jgi:tryptophanyl-tRNA synthetase